MLEGQARSARRSVRRIRFLVFFDSGMRAGDSILKIEQDLSGEADRVERGGRITQGDHLGLIFNAVLATFLASASALGLLLPEEPPATGC